MCPTRVCLQWAAKVAAHVPAASRVTPGRVRITVAHPMSAADDHWTEWLLAVDARDGRTILGGARFLASDASAVLEIEETTPIMPLAFCSKHGLWRGEVV